MRTKIILLLTMVLFLYSCGEKDEYQKRVITKIENLSGSNDVTIKVLDISNKLGCEWDYNKDAAQLEKKIGKASYDKLQIQHINVSVPFLAAQMGHSNIDLQEAQTAAEYIDKVLAENKIKPKKYFITCKVEMKKDGLKMRCTYACLVDDTDVIPILVDDTIKLNSDGF